ncbi:MAG TPA: PQQ-binding-like beta-propeller repeat protein, partial [Planctomycetaceae bacterium]|nr:PQQ-binding-like beta-propeller repeat protein [Planctomycetaceae bacterium]
MSLRLGLTSFVLLSTLCSLTHAENWPRFRGPTGQGISSETKLPVEWDGSKSIAWKTPIPGDGWSSPIVWNDRVYVTAATDNGEACHILALDRDTGGIVWDREVFRQELKRKENKNSFATPTPCTDGERIYAAFADG